MRVFKVFRNLERYFTNENRAMKYEALINHSSSYKNNNENSEKGNVNNVLGYRFLMSVCTALGSYYSIKLCGGLILLIVFFSCSKAEENHTLFQNIPSTITHVDFENKLIPTDQLNILDYLYFYNGGGVAVGDINNDQLVDVFFTSNQGENKLYQNLGNFRFQDVTKESGVSGSSDWNTGAVMADVNGDGFLDIYVCAVTGILGLKGKNELYINNGNGTFTEKASSYGLAFENYSTSAAFFDYDRDGDLDMYLLNHAIHTQKSYGKADIRNTRVEASGDKLLRNDGNVFTDVSEQAGIFGGANGYGLGIATADFDQNGYTDIYVSNDFHEDDYYYLNNGDGTFTESLKQHFGHTSRFSMGSDVSDINHDGYTDLLTLDMISDDEKVLKASMGDETLDMLQMRVQRLGYHYQFSRNMLQINQGGQFFSETALLSGVAATDWSWSALFADYDLDGEQDIFVANGIPKRPNDQDYIRYISDKKIKEKLNSGKQIDQEVLDVMPSGAVSNMMFKGKEGIGFSQAKHWIANENSISNGSAYADLDNDGDLDIITNNSNQRASFYKNTASEKGNFLKLKFRYKKKNPFGIGTKVYSYHKGVMQYQQLFMSKGFQSSSEPALYFGYGDITMIDSLKVVWPDQTFQVAEGIKTNQTLEIQTLHKRSHVDAIRKPKLSKKIFKKIDSIPGLYLDQSIGTTNDFNREKLIPYKVSDRGYAVAIGDINGDDKDDIFLGGDRGKVSKIYLQQEHGFAAVDSMFYNDKKSKDVEAVIEDFDTNGFGDIYVGTAKTIRGHNTTHGDRLYTGKRDTIVSETHLKIKKGYTSVIAPYDFDQDGDLDLFIGKYTMMNNFGSLPESYMLINNKGSFEIQEVPEFSNLGMVTDAVWSDFDQDGVKDLIVIGEWMSPTFFRNNKGVLEEVTEQVCFTKHLNGLWQAIEAFDIDGDGDQDYVLGNFGKNTKFKGSNEEPMRMYYDDFDTNGTDETILTVVKEGKEYTLFGLDELSSQLNFLRKKFTQYSAFAGKTVDEVLDKKKLKKAKRFDLHQLASGYLENIEGKYSFKPFEESLQVAPIRELCLYDFDQDGKEEIIMGGNYFGVIPFHGRYAGFGGALIDPEKGIIHAEALGINWYGKAIDGLEIIKYAGGSYLLVMTNTKGLEIYAIEN